MKKGIDVSKHQGKFNWEAVKDKIDFAILRSSHGMNEIDPEFERNYNECNRLGIPIGAYHYFYYSDADVHGKEIDNFLKTVKGKKFDLPLFIDYEEYKVNNPKTLGHLTKEQITEYALSDIAKIKSAGFVAGMYANKNWLTNKMMPEKFGADVWIWLAQYATKKTYTGRVDMWQYTSSGAVDGYAGKLDMNECYREWKKPQPVSDVKEYSLKRDGEKYLSEHFKVKEFKCKDGSDKILVSDSLIKLLEKIRGHFGRTIRVSSGYRTVSYNARVKGSPKSQHLYGTAADIQVSGIHPNEVYKYCDSIVTGGCGKYNTFTHVDVRKNKARWVG